MSDIGGVGLRREGCGQGGRRWRYGARRRRDGAIGRGDASAGALTYWMRCGGGKNMDAGAALKGCADKRSAAISAAISAAARILPRCAERRAEAGLAAVGD